MTVVLSEPDPERLLDALETFRRDTGVRRIWTAMALIVAAAALAALSYMFARDRAHVLKERVLLSEAQALSMRLAAAQENARQANDQLREYLKQQQHAAHGVDVGTSAAAVLATAIGESDRVDEALSSKPLKTGAAGPAPVDVANLPSSQTVARGPTTGWDVDVFWCRSPRQSENYQIASRAAAILGTRASAESPLAAGIALGRIRLRSALPALGPKPTGFYSVSDGSPGEDDVAKALSTTLNQAGLGQTFTTERSHGGRTAFYLSVFVCTS